MQRIDGFFLFQTGHRLRKVLDVNGKLWDGDLSAHSKKSCLPILADVELSLLQLLFASVFRFPISLRSGTELLELLRPLVAACEACSDFAEPLLFSEISPIQSKYREFEAVLRAELGQMGLFLVHEKNAMNTVALVEAGDLAFPLELAAKAPAALADVKDAMRCIALELPTAAAFHLHRANEVVFKLYWATQTGESLPDRATMGQLVSQMTERKLGNPAIVSSQRDITKLHRNPTIHPEQRLENVEEALNLYGAIRSVIGFMLAELPTATEA